ncbi:MAG TPA: (2Fe-2S)-binding protein [Oleiagrimonas sp.]|nr:(2Fe-2S)-binding protein [Oleiagrimonas sp.]
MYVCICQSVTEDDIRQAAADGVRDFAELQACTGCSTGCGCCEAEARRMLREARRELRLALPIAVAA